MGKIGKVVSILSITLICAGTLLFSKSTKVSDDENIISTKAQPAVDLSFSVLGDIHGNAQKLQGAVDDLYKVRSDMDAMVLNGDTVDQGLQSQYSSIKKILDNNKRLLPKVLISNIGNHEFFDYEKGPNTQAEVEMFLKRYYEFSGEESVYHDNWINNYHFISLGSEIGNTKDFGAVKAFISQKQQKWLKEKLAEGYEKGKPIFVFLHQHLSSSTQGWVGVEQGKDLIKILSAYPEVILFTSHTHASPLTTNVTLNQPYTMVHTGAINYTIGRDEKGARKTLYDSTYGVYVEAEGNKVTIKGRDFENKTWIYTKEISK